MAVALHLVGARPISEGTGRIARFELIPLEELEGRPRVDVLCNMSGIFRDSFQNVVELLDDLFQRAASADEPESLNFVRSALRPLKPNFPAANPPILPGRCVGDASSAHQQDLPGSHKSHCEAQFFFRAFKHHESQE